MIVVEALIIMRIMRKLEIINSNLTANSFYERVDCRFYVGLIVKLGKLSFELKNQF